VIAQPDPKGWFAPALALVAAVTALRLALLVFDRTDLFVDEAQYWLWGQNLAFGYFSKPPLIAWLIGSVTWLAGSDAPFWVRMPGAVLHAATALILGALAARLQGRTAALWVVAAYLTLPMVAVGSILISTDTVMAPFFAAALLFHHRLLTTGRARDAALTGLMIGVACLAKYAGVYFLLGAALAALFRPEFRPKLRHVALMLLIWAAILVPNTLWNLNHDFSTIRHTADNIGWVEKAAPASQPSLAALFSFWTSQTAVVGPLVLLALLLGLRRVTRHPYLAAFVIPALLVVSVQALLNRAYANWAISAYFSGTILAMMVLAAWPRLRWASVLSNALVCLVLPVLTLFPGLSVSGQPLLHHYLGRADLSLQIIAAARQAGGVPVVATNRDILADLFYTGRDARIDFYAPRPARAPQNHYEQRYPLPATLTGPLLVVAPVAPDCPFTQYRLDDTGGAYAKFDYQAYLVDAACLNAP
jgi:hypothetical protein